jgi:hypothetical protein
MADNIRRKDVGIICGDPLIRYIDDWFFLGRYLLRQRSGGIDSGVF